MTLMTPVRTCKDCPAWVWTLLPLLLAAALSIPLLGNDAFTGDEPKTLFAAGVLSSGPQTPAGVLEVIAEKSSEQALGWPLLVFFQGHLVGWSEVAIRMLPVLTGMLAIAVVARAGRDFLSPAASLYAALLLSGSAFFLTYMTHARAFTTVALCAALCVWCYWRVALRPGAPGRAAQAGLLTGATGLLYLHYVGALLLPALGLFHLLFVAKKRRWWRPVILLGLAGLAAAAQLPVFLIGMERTLSNETVQSRAISAAEVLTRFVRLMSNNLVRPAPALVEVAGVLLLLALVIGILLRLRPGHKVGVVWMLVFVSATMLVLLLAINDRVGLVDDTRIRYLMPLWPLTALIVGAGLWQLARRQRRLVTGLLACWLALGAWLSLASDFRYESGYIRRSDMHRAYQVVGELIPAADALILDHEAGYLDWQHLYVQMLDLPYVLYIRHRDDPLKHVLRLNADYPYLWLLFLTQDSGRMDALAAVLERVPCKRALDGEWDITLVRYARSPVHCPGSPARLQFDSGIQLTGPEIRLEGGMLRFHAGFRSDDQALLARYSLAIHVIDVNSGERVAQGDVGVGPGSFVPVSNSIDINGLSAGEYAIHVALYDWQSGARLPARDLETDAVSDMHALHRIQLG